MYGVMIMMKKNEFDNKKIEEINTFLDRIYQISKSYPLISEDIVYNELRRYSLKRNDFVNSDYGTVKDVEFLFEPLKKYFNKRKRLSVEQYEDWKHFLCFDSNPSLNSDKFLKLYIPIDSNHLEESSKKIFDFIERLGVRHISKIARVMRSDNVVVRLPYKFR